MQSGSRLVEPLDDDDRKDIQRRIMQIALSHRINSGLDALHVHRLQAAGLLEDVTAPDLPESMVEKLREIHEPPGPYVFVREEKTIHIVEPEALLLHPTHDTRSAALDYLKTAASLPDPWLAQRTRRMLDEQTADLQSLDVAKWRPAGMRLLMAIRQDLFRQLAGLGQSLSAKYQEGIDENVASIMVPRLEVLMNLEPPLLRPSDQRELITTWIDELSAKPSVSEALDGYLNHCGFIPLCNELSAAELARRWLRAHDNAELRWGNLWSWAEQARTPFARYHALVIGLLVPNVVTGDSTASFWNEYSKVVSPSEINEGRPSNDDSWRLFCELATHYTHHIEAIHPGPDGESVACSAWWLADLVGRVLSESNAQTSGAFAQFVAPQTSLSYMRWAVSRSPVAASTFRSMTLHIHHVWAMSLLAQLAGGVPTVQVDTIPNETRATIRGSFLSYVLTTPLAVRRDSLKPVFAFEEAARILDLCTALFPEDEESKAVAEFVKRRSELSEGDNLKTHLEQLPELSPREQQMLLFALKEAVFASQQSDVAILEWLEHTEEAVGLMLELSEDLLSCLLETLLELQQRQSAEWIVRIPHILAYAIEQSGNESRARLFYLAILLLSHNAGIVSPIQRVASSKWSVSFLAELRRWRETLAALKYSSEPWVVARIRASSAAVSRLIGPRKDTRVAPEEDK